jgi:hypothetical protein
LPALADQGDDAVILKNGELDLAECNARIDDLDIAVVKIITLAVYVCSFLPV